MPFLGAHTSIVGGLHNAFERMVKIGGQALQIFTRNQRQWNARSLEINEIRQFRLAHFRCGKPFIVSHASYLINLGTYKGDLAQKSVVALAEELKRCQHLGIPWVVVHPGSHVGCGIAQGVKNVADNLKQAVKLAGADNKVGILLETVAGQGTSIGGRFEEIAHIIKVSALGPRIGVCVDTCHIFAAGYDIRSRESYEKTMKVLDKTVGLHKIGLFHLNDSQKGLGSRIDRHEHIGYGQIGLSAFAYLLNDSRFKPHPMILETPKGKNMQKDIENLRLLRSLQDKKFHVDLQ